MPWASRWHREIGLESSEAYRRRLHVNEAQARALALETTLHGHEGCVNRLAWNEEGTLLASASDDRKVILWPYPDTDRIPIALSTEHRQNLFGVKFLPATNNRRIVTGAMDNSVQMHELDAAPQPQLPGGSRRGSSSGGASSSGGGVDGEGGAGRRGGGGRAGMRRHGVAPPLQRVQPRTTVYGCHRSRVKDVEVEPGNPHMFWSASEDGYLRQHDIRTPSHKAFNSPNALVAIRGPNGRPLELKGLDICGSAPHLMAVACGDPTVRVFDRRKLSLGAPEAVLQGRGSRPVLALAPPHLPLALKGHRAGRAHATCVNFSGRGDRLVATYHGDHAYAFDVTGSGGVKAAFGAGQQQRHDRNHHTSYRPASTSYPATSTSYPAASRAAGPPSPDLPEPAERAKLEGNAALFEDRFSAAVEAFTRAIAAAPWAPSLYAQRANALLKRGWEGDAAFALRDADAAVRLDANAAQGRYRRAQAFRALGQYRCALAACDDYARRFPDRDTEELSRMRAGIVSELEDHVQRSKTLRMQRRRRRTMPVPAAGEDEMALDAPAGPGIRVATDEDSDQDHSNGPAAAFVHNASSDEHSDGDSDDESDTDDAGDADDSDEEMRAASSSDDDSDDEPLLELYGDELGLDSYSRSTSGCSASTSAAGCSRGLNGSSGDAQNRAGSSHDCAANGVNGSCEAGGSNGNAKDGNAQRSGSQKKAQQQRQQRRRRHYPRAAPGAGLWDATAGGRRLLARFAGHCNVQTDIKEAVFLGHADALVACGSDDGRVFIYDAESGLPVRVLEADEDVANCVQCHPSEVVLATSGIEHGIKLWSPTGHPEEQLLDGIIANNQERMRGGGTPLLRTVHPAAIQAALEDNPELLQLLQRAYGFGAANRGTDADDEGEGGVGGGGAGEVTCRVT